ncbi:MAG: hypothetical protein KGQ49_06675, partial [Verrucomicrobia bacterium]|nr:hypothetical protein [Verrucomicrobiota bacterium]
WAEKDLQAIVEVRWKEEEKIAQEHHLLTHAQELSEKVVLASSLLEEALPSIKKASNALEHATRLDGQLASLVQSMRSALLELDEAVRSMQSYASRIEVNPDRLEALETEIGKIVALKRRFGPDLESQKQKLLSSIEYLTHLDVGGLEKTLAALQTKNASWKQSITAKRRASAPSFTALVLEELKSLNLPHAQFTVSIEEQIQFLFSANPGHPPLPLEKCASGGELSRLLLAIKTILSAGQSTLVFDEIDSNVGGQTASAIGEKLKRLAQSRQVICVTHFVQVAKYGNEHFLVSKQTREDHTYTLVHKMSESEKQREYNRMIGS